MDVTTAIGAGLASLSQLKNIVSGLSDLNDLAKLTTLKVEMNQALLSAQSAQFDLAQSIKALQDVNAELEEECVKLREQLKERAQYHLKRLPTGTHVYEFQPVEGASEPAHYLCAPCFNEGKKSVLNLGRTLSGHPAYNCTLGGMKHQLLAPE